MTKQIGKLYALETAPDVHTWRQNFVLTSNDRIIALTAEAALELNHLGISHTTIEEYYDEVELHNYADANNSVIVELCKLLDDLLGIEKTAELPPFSTFYYVAQLRVFYDTFQHASYILNALILKLCPKKIIMVDATSPRIPDSYNLIVPDPHFFSWVLQEICHQKNIQIECFKSTKTNHEIKKETRSIKKLLKEIKYFLKNSTFGKCDIAYFNWPQFPNKQLSNHGLKALKLPFIRHDKTKEVCISLELIKKFFIFQEVEIGNLILPYLEFFVDDFRQRHIACLQKYEKILKRKGIKACVSFQGRTIENVSTLLAARRLGIPAIIIQHGGFIGYCEWSLAPLSDFNINDYYFTYGPSVNDYFAEVSKTKNRHRSKKIEMMSVGSVNVEKIYSARNIETNQKPKVLYVSTKLVGCLRYLARHHRPDILYMEIQRQILQKLIDASDEWDVSYKPYSDISSELALKYCPDEQIDKLTILSEESLWTVLKEQTFDLIIADSVTTVLLESLATNATIVTWFDKEIMKLNKKAERMLVKRAEVAFSPTQYLDCIDQALIKALPSKDIDDEFLNNYALGSLNPSEEQVKMIKKILEKDKFPAI